MPSISTEAILFNPDPCAYLPHRPPFLFIDTILALEPGVSATGVFAAAAGGYFPPLLLVEAMAQLGGIAAGQQKGEGGVLAALGRVDLPEAVRPEARFIVCSRIVKVFGRLIQVEGEVREVQDKGAVVALATLTLAIGSPT